MIARPTALEPETQDEDQLSESNRELKQEAEIWELCRTLQSLESALCHLIPVLERLHSDIQHDQGLKRNIQDLQHESDLRRMETKSNSHQNQTPVSSNTTDIIQPATPDEHETPSLHQPCLPAHYGMNGGEEHQTLETITALSKPVAAPLDATHQTSAVAKSDTTHGSPMLGTVSSVLIAPIPFEVASCSTTVASAAPPTFRVSSAFAPSSVVTTGTVDFKLPLVYLTPAAPSVQEGPTVHVVVDEDQARVQTPDTEALQTPAPVSVLPPTVPKRALVEPTQEAPAPSSSPSGQEAVFPLTVVETPYFGTASAGLSTTVPGGFATPVFGQAPRILKPQSSIKASNFSFKPSSCGKQRGFGQFNVSATSSTFGLQSNNGSVNLTFTERQLGINTTPSSEQESPTVHVVVDEDQARVQTPDTEALQTPTPVSALPPTVPKRALVEPTQEAPAPSSSPSGQEAVFPPTVVETPYFGTASAGLSTTVPGGFATPVVGQAPRILKPQSSIKASNFSFKPSSCGKQRGFGQFNVSATSSSFNLPLISVTPAALSLREEGATVCGTVDEDQATVGKLATQAFQSPTPVLALTPTVPNSALVEPTKKVPAASRILKPQSSIKAADFSFKPSTCEKQRGFGKFNISATSSSFGLQSNNGSVNLAITERQLGINTTPSCEQESPTVHVNVDENQAPDRTPDTPTFQTRLPVLALPSTVPSSVLLEPTQEEPAASICPSSQELILPSTAVETPYLGTAASGLLSSVHGGFAAPVFGQATTIIGPESSMTTANLSFRPLTCGTQRGLGQFSINETSSSFGLQSHNVTFNFANTERRLGINTTSSFGQSPGSLQVNPSSFNRSPGNFSFHPTSPSCGRQLVRSQPDVSDVDFSLAPLGFSTQSALDETPASSTFRRRCRHRRWRNHTSPVTSSSDIIPFAGREEVWSSSRTTMYIQSGRGRRKCKISVTVQNSSRSLIDRSRNPNRGFVEQRRVVRLQEYYQEYSH